MRTRPFHDSAKTRNRLAMHLPMRRSSLGPVLFSLLLVTVSLWGTPEGVRGQSARISEESRLLATYPFSEPNPVPILIRDPRLYPYHSFEGYSATSEPQEWKVVKLENEYIEVFVLPEVGGKVWGAVVKESGHEFIYRNEVMKFRNIALRGPWTSGGIEFNFGIIGHTPATATPVDYTLVENPDGSVSCWVGSMDLPSRTHWRVEIRLPADRAYFETNVLWYNPTPLPQPYYNWMTGAAFAQDDLEMSIPGNAYLRHSGQVETWPLDQEGRYLPLYAENTFEGHKSYHVVGELNDFFGGYYKDEEYGFGHWARYEDMPGQKLWLWALSREGGVWEDLLTDTDGQYVEFQAGRLFVQYSPGSHVNPITQAAFDPMSASRWSETWFPVEGIGGLTDASRDGALFARAEDGVLTVGINAFLNLQDTLEVWSGGEPVTSTVVELEALQPFRTTIDVSPGQPYRIRLKGLGLDFESDPSERRLSRPFATDPEVWEGMSEVDRKVFQAGELMKAREHKEAWALFEAALADEPGNRKALLGLADLSFRRALPRLALGLVNRALQLDAYDAEANFLAGTIYRSLGMTADAREAFGWAARATAYRSAAYAQLAELMIGSEDFSEAVRYARLAIDYDRWSVPGWRALAVVGRASGDDDLAVEARRELRAQDPLHHFVTAEEYLAGRENQASPGSARTGAEALFQSMGGEYPHQTLLELAIGYVNMGLKGDALALLQLAEETEAGSVTGIGKLPMLRVWRAWLENDPGALAGPGDPAFSFPYRPESLPPLQWASRVSDEWVWDYLLALELWALGREEEASRVMSDLKDLPGYGPVYAARAHLARGSAGSPSLDDLARAVEGDPETRTLHVLLVQALESSGRWEEALAAVEEAQERFPEDFNLALLKARAFLNLNRAVEAAHLLAATRILPSENARESHLLYEQAHTMAALDAFDEGAYEEAKDHLLLALEWPESLGQGRPYQPEERLVRFLLGKVEEKLGNAEEAAEGLAFRADLEDMAGGAEGVAADLIERALALGLGVG